MHGWPQASRSSSRNCPRSNNPLATQLGTPAHAQLRGSVGTTVKLLIRFL